MCTIIRYMETCHVGHVTILDTKTTAATQSPSKTECTSWEPLNNWTVPAIPISNQTKGFGEWLQDHRRTNSSRPTTKHPPPTQATHPRRWSREASQPHAQTWVHDADENEDDDMNDSDYRSEDLDSIASGFSDASMSFGNAPPSDEDMGEDSWTEGDETELPSQSETGTFPDQPMESAVHSNNQSNDQHEETATLDRNGPLQQPQPTPEPPKEKAPTEPPGLQRNPIDAEMDLPLTGPSMTRKVSVHRLLRDTKRQISRVPTNGQCMYTSLYAATHNYTWTSLSLYNSTVTNGVQQVKLDIQEEIHSNPKPLSKIQNHLATISGGTQFDERRPSSHAAGIC